MSIDFSQMTAAQIENHARGRELRLGPWGRKIVQRIREAFPGAYADVSDWNLYLQAHHRWDRMVRASDRLVVESFAPRRSNMPQVDTRERTSGETQAAAAPAVIETLERVTASIAEIDEECRTILGGVEHGLVNVKAEFRELASRQTGKKLTEETLIAWLVQQKLVSAGRQIDWEVPYPGHRQSACDLVIDVGARCRLWLELKLSWKAWFNCRSAPTYSNGWYQSYLWGTNRTHSFRHDFEKLGNARIPGADHRAVCLIGFDRVQAPMDAEVMAVVHAAREEDGRWVAATERCWSDRRCRDFRINVWSWVLSPM